MRWKAGRRPRLPAVSPRLQELVSIDPDAGTIAVAFAATDQFLNPAGVIQGGFVAAMLDDTMGPALVATLGPGQFAPTTDLHVQFLRPARPGRLIGRGRVVRRGRDVAFLAGELADDSGELVAVATATALQIRAHAGASATRDPGRLPRASALPCGPRWRRYRSATRKARSRDWLRFSRGSHVVS